MSSWNSRNAPGGTLGTSPSFRGSSKASDPAAASPSKAESLQRLKNLAAARMVRKSTVSNTGGEGLISSSRTSGTTGSRPGSASQPKPTTPPSHGTRPPSSGRSQPAADSTRHTIPARTRSTTTSSIPTASQDTQPAADSSTRLFQASNRTRATPTTSDTTAERRTRSSAPQIATQSTSGTTQTITSHPRASATGQLGSAGSSQAGDSMSAPSAHTSKLGALANRRVMPASSTPRNVAEPAGSQAQSANRPASRQKATSASASTTNKSGVLSPSSSGRFSSSSHTHQAPGPQPSCKSVRTPPKVVSAKHSLNMALPPDAIIPPEAIGPLTECPSCGRCFNDTAYPKHVKVCEKVFMQKRKQFDSASVRLAGSEAAQFATKGSKGSATSAARGSKAARPAAAPAAKPRRNPQDDRPIPRTAENSKPAWKSQSEHLRAAMKASRMISAAQARGQDIRTLNLPAAPEEADDRVPCPHCGRKFAILTAERHIPKCKETVAKPSLLKAGGGKGAHMRNGKPSAPGRR